MHLTESAAPFGSSQLQSSINSIDKEINSINFGSIN